MYKDMMYLFLCVGYSIYFFYPAFVVFYSNLCKQALFCHDTDSQMYNWQKNRCVLFSSKYHHYICRQFMMCKLIWTLFGTANQSELLASPKTFADCS